MDRRTQPNLHVLYVFMNPDFRPSVDANHTSSIGLKVFVSNLNRRDPKTIQEPEIIFLIFSLNIDFQGNFIRRNINLRYSGTSPFVHNAFQKSVRIVSCTNGESIFSIKKQCKLD